MEHLEDAGLRVLRSSLGDIRQSEGPLGACDTNKYPRFDLVSSSSYSSNNARKNSPTCAQHDWRRCGPLSAGRTVRMNIL